MAAESAVHFAGSDPPADWGPIPLPAKRPRSFVADPPDDLSRANDSDFTDVDPGSADGDLTPDAKSPHGISAGAKSPHGITRTGIQLIDESPPSRGSVSGRRPVVAILDTAIATHPWLGDGSGPDPFWRPAARETLPQPWRAPRLAPGDLSDPAGAAAKVYGHGTFIAGIVRQLAPEARVLALPVMSDAGHADTPVVLETLDWLLRRVQLARREQRPELFVDVINLSFGWYPDDEYDEFPAEEYRAVLDGLGAAGVRVVASAGNRSSTEPVYPAAFAREQVDSSSPETALVSVGALDPNGELAAYSNAGNWVRLLAPGTSLISTVPRMTDVDWSATPTAPDGVPYPKPQLQARGFARWGGTSFAAAWVSAQIAAHLLDYPHGAHLDDLDLEAAHARAAVALAATEAEIDVWRKQSHGSW